MTACPLCRNPVAAPHAPGCPMECPWCKPTVGTGHRDGCDMNGGLASYVHASNPLLRLLGMQRKDKA